MLETLRLGGWRAVAVSPASPLPAAWAAFDADGAAPLAAAARCPPRMQGPGDDTGTAAQRGPAPDSPGLPRPAVPRGAAGPPRGPGRRRRRWAPNRGSWPLAVAIAVAGAALRLNGVLRGWAWYSPVLTTVLTVALTMAVLRALRWRSRARDGRCAGCARADPDVHLLPRQQHPGLSSLPAKPWRSWADTCAGPVKPSWRKAPRWPPTPGSSC